MEYATAMPCVVADDDATLLFLAESLTDAYTQGVVEHRLRLAVAALLPNVAFLRCVATPPCDGALRHASFCRRLAACRLHAACQPWRQSRMSVAASARVGRRMRAHSLG